MDSEAPQTTSLIRKRTDNELMPPPPAAKRIKRPKTVLDEDSYTQALSHILARDFFPGLLESQTQNEYLDALESRDVEWISSASRRLQSVMTPGRSRTRLNTPSHAGGRTPVGYNGDTPKSTAASSIASAADGLKGAAIDTNMSLGSFQAKYTSEDNESFYKLLDKQNQKKMDKYAWVWTGNKLPSKMQLKQREVEMKLAKTRASLVDDGFAKDRLAIKDKDDRPAQPDHWQSKPNNELMFPPEGVDGVVESVAERAQTESRAAPKMIVYENTRVPQPHVPRQQRASSPTLSEIRGAISGKRRGCDQESSTGGGEETPRVNGYTFVDEEEPVSKHQDSAPIIDLGAGDATPNPFQLQEQGKREALHHRMVERIAQSQRTSARLGVTGKVERTPVPKFPSSPRVSGGLTPAAQRLWGKIDSAGRKASSSPFNGAKVTPMGRISGLRNTTR